MKGDRQGRGTVRCAIYTRKSSEEGLEQDFNSLHAQREACEAYVASQRHEGWVASKALYDDGGFSGGTLERPALQTLLSDAAEGSIDVVVVYKIDRLTRSLLDFAKIVEIFDKRNVSFVSVTQQFNTTSSMGRLTLNVLLSFAQFEREVTGERIRDKIAASKRKGMWMGGHVPLGYEAKDRTLAINEAEAATVRRLFDLYLALGNVRLVQAEAQRQRLTTKARTINGKVTGGRPFSRGHIYKILSNPLYVGEIEHKGQRHVGQHPAIVDRDIFDAVQARLAYNAHAHRTGANAREPSLLAGLLFDEAGNRFTATHAVKGSRRYRYYEVKAKDAGARTGAWTEEQYEQLAGRHRRTRYSKRKSRPPRTIRIPAGDIEALVIGELRRFLRDHQRIASALGEAVSSHQLATVLENASDTANRLGRDLGLQRRTILREMVDRIVVGPEAIDIEVAWHPGLRGEVASTSSRRPHTGAQAAITVLLRVPSNITARKSEAGSLGGGEVPIDTFDDMAAVKAHARGFVWLEELTSGRAKSIREIAGREGVSDRYVVRIVEQLLAE